MAEILIPVVRTKVILPRRRPDILSRQRLLSYLDELIENRLIIVAAPAGYGKTSLLVDFAHSTAMPVCWLSLDTMDSEPQRFIAGVIAAIQTTFPDFGKTSIPALNGMPQERLNLDALVSLIVNDIYETIDQHFVLVIDDYHLVEKVQEINYFINRFLLLADENCHVIISSRRLLPLADMPLLVARSMVGGIGFEELAFQPEEIRNLYLQNFGISLTDQQLEELSRLTEGWITGLILSTQIENGQLTTRFRAKKVAGVSLYDYLAQQVVDQQSEYLKRFLYRTSLFEEFDAEICASVLGKGLNLDEDWNYLIHEVQRNNLFVLPIIEEERIWLRYHHLFRDYLQNRLNNEFPDEARRIQERLAEYYQEVEEWERAYQIYERVGNKEAKARLIEKAGGVLVSKGRILTLQSWLEDLPSFFIERSPFLLSIQGVVRVMLGEVKEGIESFNLSLGLCSEKDTILYAHTLIRRSGAFRIFGDHTRALEDAEKALQILEHFPAEKQIFATGLHAKGIVLNYLGKIRDSLHWLNRAREIFFEIGDEESATKVAMGIAMAYRYLGDLESAEKIYKDALLFYQNSGNVIWQANLLNNLGVLHALAGYYETALEELEKAISYATLGGDNRLKAYALTSLGDLFKDVGAIVEAEQAYRKANQIIEQIQDQFLRFYLTFAISELQVSQNQIAEAEATLSQAWQMAADAGSLYEENLCRWLSGKIAIIKGNLEIAVKNLEEAEKYFSLERHHVEAIRCRLLLLVVYGRVKNQNKLKNLLEELLPVVQDKKFHNLVGSSGRLLQETFHNEGGNSEDVRLMIVPFLKVIQQHEKQLPNVRKQLRQRSQVVPVSPPELIILTFGRIQVALGDHIITGMEWRSQAARDLMLLLMLHPEGLTKEQIGLIFWPDISPPELKLRFKNTIYRLRHAAGKDVIIFEDDIYYFNRGMDYEADFETFNHEIQLAGLSRKPDQQIKHYRNAVELYKGEFLPEINDEWALQERERLHQKYLAVLKRLIELYLETSQPVEAITFANKYLQYDPTNENIHQIILRCYASMGNMNMVEKHYKMLANLLEKEMGGEPNPQTIALYDLLTRNRRKTKSEN
ncbi:MAG: tetratricopeptide repeat protein [Chloroflexota bacterium]